MVVFLAVMPTVAATERAPDLAADLELMMTWFEGEFDNNLQVLEEKEDPPEQPHEWIHSIFKRVDLPAFGDNVYYVEQYGDGDPSKIYRSRLYSFGLDEEEGAIELVIYRFADQGTAAGAQEDPSKLEGMTPQNLTTIPGCEVYWRREEDRFVGSVKEGACRVASRRSGKTLVISDDLVLTPDEIWISDRAEDEDGNWVFGNKAGIHHKLARARRFTCWAALEQEESEEWQGFRDLELHDQGGRAALEVEGEEEAGYTVLLEQRVYKGEEKIPVLKLALEEAGSEESKAYTWANPDAWRIGMNLRWMQVGCTAEGRD
jgi:hypothetical protein